MEPLPPLPYPNPVVDAVSAAAVFIDTAASVVVACCTCCWCYVLFCFCVVFVLFVVVAVPVGDDYRIMKTSFSSHIFFVSLHIVAVVCAVLAPLAVPGVVV